MGIPLHRPSDSTNKKRKRHVTTLTARSSLVEDKKAAAKRTSEERGSQRESVLYKSYGTLYSSYLNFLHSKN